ncbi:hypothetical protein ON010_g18970 [Phytophthora cinnamomi]|nr:hypothetical protein ON010_g18970 [Phytophthora cinnamomi]
MAISNVARQGRVSACIAASSRWGSTRGAAPAGSCHPPGIPAAAEVSRVRIVGHARLWIGFTAPAFPVSAACWRRRREREPLPSGPTALMASVARVSQPHYSFGRLADSHTQKDTHTQGACPPSRPSAPSPCSSIRSARASAAWPATP